MNARLIALALGAALSIAPSSTPAAVPLRPGQVAPDFTLPGVDGKPVALARLHGKPLYINFFASWCGPCRAEAPSIKRFSQQYRARGLQIIGIDDQESKEKAEGFVKQFGLPYRVGLGDQKTRDAYGVLALPVHVFIDRSGVVKLYRLGEMTDSEIEAAIKSIL